VIGFEGIPWNSVYTLRLPKTPHPLGCDDGGMWGSLALPTIVPLAELFCGELVIVSDFINGPLGNIFVRFSASVITV
jgi:hypothetical protein